MLRLVEKPAADVICYFSVEVCDDQELEHPENLIYCKSKPGGFDYFEHVAEAKAIFERICPGSPFLPKLPEPVDPDIDQPSTEIQNLVD